MEVTKDDRKSQITIDSGACDMVMPVSLCADIPVLAPMQSKHGLEYEVADGASIPNEGERKCLIMTKGGAVAQGDHIAGGACPQYTAEHLTCSRRRL